MNGDFALAQETSSASNSADVSGTVSIGTATTNWTVTTQPASWPAATTTLDAAHKASTVTLSGVPPLTATAGSGGANQLAMSTAPLAVDFGYFEVTLGVAGDTAGGKKVCVHDASLIANYSKLPGLSAGFTGAGITLTAGGSPTIAVGGATISSVDFISIPTLASAATVGMLVHRPSGRFWLQTSAGNYWPGDPTVLDGGIQLPAPLAAYYCDLCVQTNAQGETINYGPTFALGLPPIFAPHG